MQLRFKSLSPAPSRPYDLRFRLRADQRFHRGNPIAHVGVEAHAGGAALNPEYSLKAVAAAIAAGADVIELKGDTR